MAKHLVILITALLTACALPTTGVRTGSVRPTLAIKGAPDNAALYLDGLFVGSASQFNGVEKVLTIEEGAHQVDVRIEGRQIHSERIVVSTGESRTISVSGGAK